MGGRKPASRFNWLKDLDAKARDLPRAKNWLEPYGPFLLVRYPHLQSQPIPGNNRSQLIWESDLRTAARVLAEWESCIAANREASVCLGGLSTELRKQLSALMVEIVSTLETRSAENRSGQFYKHIVEEAKVRKRVLDRKLQKARQAARELKEYAEDSRERNKVEPNNARHRARQTLGYSYLIVAANALTALDAGGPHNAERHIEIATESLSPEEKDPEVFGMVQLYWFFKHACKLTGNESEVRVARLRNAFWTLHGVRKVKYRSRYDEVESQGCEAVHVAVTRFKPQGTN